MKKNHLPVCTVYGRLNKSAFFKLYFRDEKKNKLERKEEREEEIEREGNYKASTSNALHTNVYTHKNRTHLRAHTHFWRRVNYDKKVTKRKKSLSASRNTGRIIYATRYRRFSLSLSPFLIRVDPWSNKSLCLMKGSVTSFFYYVCNYQARSKLI